MLFSIISNGPPGSSADTGQSSSPSPSLDYSSKIRIQKDLERSAGFSRWGSMDPDQGPDPNLGLKIIEGKSSTFL
jgi:hypothetical protein